MADVAIVDAHVQFWDPGVHPVSWAAAHPALDRPFLPADFAADQGDVEVAAFVAVEANVDAGLYLKEAAWLAQLADAEPRLGAVVAHAPLQYGGAVGSELEKLAAQPVVRGVHRLLADRDGAALMRDAGFREAVRMLARFGLHLELGLRHDQLPAALDLVAACPEVRFVVADLAGADVASGLREPWWTRIKELAAFDHVVGCKVPGAVAAVDPDAWTASRLGPFVDRAVEVFGPERLLFAGGWPFVRPRVDYPRLVAVVEELVRDWPVADRRRLFADNARAVYGLG